MIDFDQISASIPDPAYTPDPTELAEWEANDAAYRNIMAAYDLAIEAEIDPDRIQQLRSLQNLAGEDFK